LTFITSFRLTAILNILQWIYLNTFHFREFHNIYIHYMCCDSCATCFRLWFIWKSLFVWFSGTFSIFGGNQNRGNQHRGFLAFSGELRIGGINIGGINNRGIVESGNLVIGGVKWPGQLSASRMIYTRFKLFLNEVKNIQYLYTEETMQLNWIEQAEQIVSDNSEINISSVYIRWTWSSIS
jgi:hypothetical protein